MKRKYFNKLALLIVILLPVLFLSGCTGGNRSHSELEEKKLKVAATIFPLYDIVRTVGGNRAAVKLVLSPGSSPHTFEASPGQIKELQGVKVFFSIGHGVDDWISSLADSTEGAYVVVVDKSISLQPFKNQAASGLSIDPHYWLNPENGEIIADTVAGELAKADPQNSQYYQENAESLKLKIKNKSKVWKDKLKGISRRDLVVFHDAWGYFAEYFGLNIVATFEPFPGRVPDPDYLVNLQKQISQFGVKAIFVEPQLSPEAVSALAGDLNIEVKVLDPLGGVKGRESYIDLIDFNINSVYEANK